jgi:hypothetical protein
MHTFFVSDFYVYVFTTFFERIRGVIGREELLEEGVCVLLQCNCVHSFFLHKPLYVYFFSRDYRLLFTICLSPYRISPFVVGASFVVETSRPLSSGEISDIIRALSF